VRRFRTSFLIVAVATSPRRLSLFSSFGNISPQSTPPPPPTQQNGTVPQPPPVRIRQRMRPRAPPHTSRPNVSAERQRRNRKSGCMVMREVFFLGEGLAHRVFLAKNTRQGRGAVWAGRSRRRGAWRDRAGSVAARPCSGGNGSCAQRRAASEPGATDPLRRTGWPRARARNPLRLHHSGPSLVRVHITRAARARSARVTWTRSNLKRVSGPGGYSSCGCVAARRRDEGIMMCSCG
jgi:hypothetical protein